MTDPLPIFAATASDFAEFQDFALNARTIVRLLFASLLGGILGWQRERFGKDAGLRTYMMVTLAAAFITIATRESEFSDDAMSRVVQGILTGIGFLGAGAIIKHKDKVEVLGLTTAAGIWLTTTIGIAVGFGHLALATVATALAFVILQLLAKWSDRIG